MTANVDSVSTADKLAIGGVAAVAVSMVLDWITAPEPVIIVDGAEQTTMTGWEAGDGQLVLGGVLLFAALTLIIRYRAGQWNMWASVTTGLAGLLAAGLPLLYILDPAMGAAGSPEVLETLEAGIGLYVALIGGIALLAASAIGWSNRSSAEETTASPDEAA